MNKDSTTFTDKNQSGMSCLLQAVESVTSDLLGGTTGTYTPNQSRYVLDRHRLPPLPSAHNYSIARPRVVPPIRPYSSPGNYVSTDGYSVERDYVQRFNDAAPSQYYQHENIGSSPSMPPSLNNSLCANPHFEMKKRKTKNKAPTFPELVSHNSTFSFPL